MMTERVKYVVTGELDRSVFILRNEPNLPAAPARIKITPYAIIDQKIDETKIILGLNIPTNVDPFYISFQEMETFIRALGINTKVPMLVHIVRISDEPKDRPTDLDYLDSRDYSILKTKWGMYHHFQDIKNRVRGNRDTQAVVSLGDNNIEISRLHSNLLIENEYLSDLIKDYQMGVEAKRRHPSLALLYFFKVLESVGKHEYDDKAPTMQKKTLMLMIDDAKGMLTEEELVKARDIIRWRNTKSEAHNITEGLPNDEEILICHKLAFFLFYRTLNTIIGPSRSLTCE
jgi:hypothetical protein